MGLTALPLPRPVESPSHHIENRRRPTPPAPRAPIPPHPHRETGRGQSISVVASRSSHARIPRPDGGVGHLLLLEPETPFSKCPPPAFSRRWYPRSVRQTWHSKAFRIARRPP